MPKTKTKTIQEHTSNLAERIVPTLESARDKAVPLLEDARDKAAPLMAEARDKAAPMVASGKERFTTDVLPVVTAALAAAEAATEELREEGLKRGKATVAALKGEVEPPKKTHRLRNLLVLLGLAGVAAFVAKRLGDRQATSSWQSSYTPTPAAEAGGAHRAGEGAGEGADESKDQAGATPDVAAADAAAEPHAPTTPENPAETIDVSKS